MNIDPASGSLAIKPRCALALMAKVPFAGAVKTRLTPPLSPEEAATLSTCFLRDMTTNVLDMNGEGTEGVVLYTPAEVLSHTIERAAEINLPVEFLPTWYDVDDAATLRLLCEELLLLSDDHNGQAQFRGGSEAPHTRKYLAGLIAKDDQRLTTDPLTAKTRA